jgi:hypothetical protein
VTVKTSEKLRRLSRSSTMPLPARDMLRKAADEIERHELREHAREIAARAGPQAATAPPWARYLKDEAA